MVSTEKIGWSWTATALRRFRPRKLARAFTAAGANWLRHEFARRHPEIAHGPAGIAGGNRARIWSASAVNASREREAGLEDSLAPFRVGSVKYLNAVPLTRGLESEILFATPARLAQLLQRDELDAALVSITEVLFHDRYDVLDGVAIASLGEVKSVLLAHRKPLTEAKEIFCDPPR